MLHNAKEKVDGDEFLVSPPLGDELFVSNQFHGSRPNHFLHKDVLQEDTKRDDGLSIYLCIGGGEDRVQNLNVFLNKFHFELY